MIELQCSEYKKKQQSNFKRFDCISMSPTIVTKKRQNILGVNCSQCDIVVIVLLTNSDRLQSVVVDKQIQIKT